MTFFSIEFVFIFYPFVLIFYHILNKKHPIKTLLFLFICSLFFIYKTNLTSIIVIVISSITNYIIAYYIQKCKQKAHGKILMFLGICFNICLLLSFKHLLIPSFESISNYINQEISIKPKMSIPLGLSFYTLYQISYLIDIYKKKANSISFIKYFLSISLFAQLPSGPIFSYKKMVNQFKNLGSLSIDKTMIYSGVSLFAFGLFKKITFADPLSIVVDELYVNLSQGAVFTLKDSIAATWGFLLQLYFDFSAYSDMAIGIGLSLGLRFPINFNSPLKSVSFGDYIAKWHISFMNFARDYIFLDISKKIRKVIPGSAVRKQLSGWVIGILAAYIVIAIWHSPTIKSLIQGIYIGIILIILQLISQLYFSKRRKAKSKIYKAIHIIFKKVFIMFMASFASALLRVVNKDEIYRLIKGFGNFYSESSLELPNSISILGTSSLHISILFFITIITIIVNFAPNTMEIFGLVNVEENKWYKRFFWKPNLIWGIILGFFLAYYLMRGFITTQKFLYQQF